MTSKEKEKLRNHILTNKDIKHLAFKENSNSPDYNRALLRYHESIYIWFLLTGEDWKEF